MKKLAALMFLSLAISSTAAAQEVKLRPLGFSWMGSREKELPRTFTISGENIVSVREWKLVGEGSKVLPITPVDSDNPRAIQVAFTIPPNDNGTYVLYADGKPTPAKITIKDAKTLRAELVARQAAMGADAAMKVPAIQEAIDMLNEMIEQQAEAIKEFKTRPAPAVPTVPTADEIKKLVADETRNQLLSFNVRLGRIEKAEAQHDQQVYKLANLLGQTLADVEQMGTAMDVRRGYKEKAATAVSTAKSLEQQLMEAVQAWQNTMNK